MVGSDPFNSVGSVGGATGEEADSAAGEHESGDAGWSLVANHDGAGALLDSILQLDADEAYTKTELCDASDVAYKTLYLDGTVEALVETGILESDERDGEETTFHVNADSPVYETAAAFDRSVTSRKADSS